MEAGDPDPPVAAGRRLPAFSKIYDILAAAQERIIRSNANVDQELAAAQEQSQQLLDQSISQYPNLYKSAS